MSAAKTRLVAVIGAGLMGHGIAQVFAQGGYRVTMHDTSTSLLQAAEDRIESNLRFLSEGLPDDEAGIEETMARINTTVDLEEAVGEAHFVTESVPENLQLKTELFNAMEALAPRDAILASNTSMLKITDIGKGVRDKERLVTTHWFNPPYLIPVVEVVKGAHTSPETVERTASLLRGMGKVPVRLLREVPGHLINRIQFALFRETLALLDAGVAAPEEIDRAVSGSLGLRLAAIGPLRSIDLAGLDLFWFGMKDIFRSLDTSPAPPGIIKEKVDAGHVGKKCGKGFFEYRSGGRLDDVERERDEKLIGLLKILHPGKGESGA
ncbi:MAG: 3-hydroxyacyl-CoA dehydrogenase family protein [Deltaproteobacteria bacterium]|nr:3-hydroxyacyl-CoA dehydrogenase family protein [Deltaproteobacteria bacterium]